MISGVKQLILASGSRGRKLVLEKIGVPFIVDASQYQEDMTLDLPPKQLAIKLSQGKAREVAARHKNAVVIGADSFGIFKGQLLGKPQTHKKAKEMLSALSGQTHSFITGFTIIDSDSKLETSDVAETRVTFKKLSDSEIDNYLAKENVLNNAAAYIIQGLGAVLVEKIGGDYENVIGLPLSKVAQALKDFDIQII
ncbi:septum formation protein Maf [Candidatus Saccharibacteria bacterium]|nr:septum formation protein Maf [Candidatus Saccharibacteria bacterium]